MIAITGATGLLGRAVYKYFSDSGLDVVGTGFTRAQSPILKLDLTDAGALNDFIHSHKPEILIHCAAEKRPDVSQSDPEGTLSLNVNVCQTLAPPYSITSSTNPLNFYGKSKLAGEAEFVGSGCDFSILRIPILYGECENWESSVNLLLDVISSPKNFEMDARQPRYPTNVHDIARVLFDIVGILHFSATTRFTKFDMCLVFAKILGISIKHIHPVDTSISAPTLRPNDCQMDLDRLASLGIDLATCDFETWFTKYLLQS